MNTALVITAETGTTTSIVGVTHNSETAKKLVRDEMEKMGNTTITQDWSFKNSFGEVIKTEVLYCTYPAGNKTYKRIYRITQHSVQ